LRAQGAQQGDRGYLLLGQVRPADAGGRPLVASDAGDDPVGCHDDVHRHVVAGDRDRPGGEDLEFVHSGDAHGPRADQPGGRRQRELQVGETAALAESGTVLGDRH
jgi:hypothetical protein